MLRKVADGMVAALEQRLALYRQRQPYRVRLGVWDYQVESR